MTPSRRHPDAPAEDALSTALHTIADQAHPLTTSDGLWARGRRRHRRRIVVHLAATVLVLIAALTVPTILARGLPWTAPPPAQPRPSVPATVAPPLPGQRTVQDSPLGPATLVVTGDGYFRSGDVFDPYEDDGMVVGRSGFNRMVRYNGVGPGPDLLLSPDGRYLAGDASMEDAVPPPVTGGDPADFLGSTALLDLATGDVRTFRAGYPMVWSPDGRLLTFAGAGSNDGLRLLDARTGDAPRVFRPPYPPSDKQGVVFSPDGKRLAVVSGPTVYQVDVATQQGRPLFDLSENQVLAGRGAWTPDGLLTLWELGRCRNDVCGSNPGTVQARDYRVTYVDAETGAAATGPDLDVLSAHKLRLLGWTPDGAAIVYLLHQGFPPEYQHTSQVLALRPGGGHSTLVALPPDAREVDVAQDVIQQGLFGGSTPSWAARVADVIDSRRSNLLWILAIAGAVFLAARLFHDHRRRRPPPEPRPWEHEHEADSW